MSSVPSLTAGFEVFVVVATSLAFVTADLSIVPSVPAATLLMRRADWLSARTVSLFPKGAQSKSGAIVIAMSAV